MANKTLIAQNSLVQAYPPQTFSGADSIRIVQFNPQVGQGFSGAVVIEGSFAPTPSNTDFAPIMTVTFTGHTQNLTLEVQSGAPTIRARIAASQGGSIAVFADSADRAIQGGQGATPATAIVDSPSRAAGSGSSFKINTITVPAITSDDVFYANDFTKTVTDMLDGTNGAVGKQDKIGNGLITITNVADINQLGGTAAYGLVTADLNKLADVNVSAAEINRLVGLTSPVQAQLTALAATIPPGFGGLTTTAAEIDQFFDAPIVVSLADLNNLNGLTASAADLNGLTGTVGTFTPADLIKLGQITTTSGQINALSGYVGTSADLNRIVGLLSSNLDLSSIAGYAAQSISATEFGYLNGLTQNLQLFINSVPVLTGLTASVSDLNTFTGIFSGVGAYSNPITSAEINTLNGITSNIQNQLNQRRLNGVPIGIAEISGSSITITEFNYLQSARANIQAQIDAISLNAITPLGGSFTGPIRIANGTVALPGLSFVAPNISTGIYLLGANGFGVSVAGVAAFGHDGTDFTVGTGVGAPQLKGVGYGVTDPAFNFSGDEDTGIHRAGLDAISLVAGGQEMVTASQAQTTIGGAVALNNAVTISGVFQGEKMLSRTSMLGGAVTGSSVPVTLYTVPVGRTCVVTRIIIRLTNVIGFVDGSLFRLNIGANPAPFEELVDNNANPTIFNPGTYAFDTAGQVIILGAGDNSFPAISGSGGADYQAFGAATQIRAQIAALAGASEFDFDVIMFGYEFV
jgi:hypothetical protein